MFDFIITFNQFVNDVITSILLLTPYDPASGTTYDWIISVVVQYAVYLLFIIAMVLVIILILGIFKAIFYMVSEAF
jgi:hypothetical protein